MKKQIENIESRRLQSKNQDFTGLVPPNAIELEEAILGAMMIDKTCCDTVFQLLASEMFYSEQHKFIFEAIQQLTAENKPVDLLTVAKKLQKMEKLEIAGGAYYLSQLCGKISSGAHAEYHAKIILQKYLERKLIEVGSETIKIGFDETIDTDDKLTMTEKLFASINDIVAGRQEIESLQSIVEQSTNNAYLRADAVKNGKIAGISTGIIDLDKKVLGWEKSNLIILAGRPGMGKTALMLHFAKNAARNGVPVVIFSLEMSGVSLVDRLLLSFCDIPAYKFRAGYLSSDELRGVDSAGEQIKILPITINATAGISMPKIRAKARMLARQGKCQMVLF
jgi:replicative DNA helicase